MASKSKILVFVPRSVVEDFPDDESIVLAEIVRSFNEKNIREIRRLKHELRTLMIKYPIISILLSIIVILTLFFNIDFGIIILPIALVTLGYAFYKRNKIINKIRNITSDIIIEGISKVMYPLLLVRIGAKYHTLIDLGAHNVPEYLKYLDFREKDNVFKAIRRTININQTLRNIIPIKTARELEKILVKELNKQRDLKDTGALEGIFLKEVKDFSHIVSENIEENLVLSRFILLDDETRKELVSLLSNSKSEIIDPKDIETIYPALIGLSIDKAITSAEDVFMIAEEFIEEQNEKDLTLIANEILNHVQAYNGLLENMRDLLSISLSSDPITFHESIRTFFCPVCTSRYIDNIKEKIDIKKWVEEKVLRGVLNDPDIVSPALIDPTETQKFREKIESVLDEKLPVPSEESYIALAHSPIMVHEKENKFKCPKCGSEFYYDELKNMNVVVPNAFIPLARGFASLFEENKEYMMNKATVIIRNIHASKLSKNQRITQLETTYRTYIEELQLKLIESRIKTKYLKKIAKELRLTKI